MSWPKWNRRASPCSRRRIVFGEDPGLLAEVFEQYLSYAIALGEEQRWDAQFAETSAEAGGESSLDHYQPGWHRSDSPESRRPVDLAKALSETLTAAILASLISSPRR